MMAQQDEQHLVSLLKNGNEDAFRILVRQYHAGLFRIACGITQDKEESLDILQEVFIKVYENIHEFRADAKLFTWLRRITINECLNWKRRWKRRFRWQHQSIDSDETGDLPELGTEEDQPERLYRKKEFETFLQNKLKELPEDARTIFLLKEIESLSYDEISELLKIKRGTVCSRLFYARKKLKESLKDYYNEGDIL